MSTRILVTGSRGWSDLDAMVAALMRAWLDLGKPARPVLVHGAARGADSMAAQLWRLWGWPDDPHPGDLHRMVTGGADLCLIFGPTDAPGARQCLAAARRAGIPVRVCGPEAAREVQAA
jgi:hypothetical protein